MEAASVNAPPAIRRQTEREFQAAVVKLARMAGWVCYHTHDSRRSEPGFPDLVLVRERVVYAELKDEKGRPTKSQADWIEALFVAGQEVYIWRPSDWDEIVDVLGRRPA